MNAGRVISLLAVMLACGACERDGITAYDAPKEESPALAPAVSAGSSSPISWTLPKGWKEEKPGQMRLASFSCARNGLAADISIVVLDGDAGGDLGNVNRWRGQINLPPLSASELRAQTSSPSIGGHAMLWVDFATPGLFIDNKFRKRLVAASYHRAGKTWFFKMTGEDALVKSLEPAFKKFIAGIRYHGE